MKVRDAASLNELLSSDHFLQNGASTKKDDLVLTDAFCKAVKDEPSIEVREDDAIELTTLALDPKNPMQLVGATQDQKIVFVCVLPSAQAKWSLKLMKKAFGSIADIEVRK